jgi:hypothetical protein
MQIKAQLRKLESENFVRDERIRVGMRWAINALRWALEETSVAPARLMEERKHPAPRTWLNQ